MSTNSEYRVIELLSLIYPEYKEFTKFERPDFVGSGIGLEITEAYIEYDGEMGFIVKKYMNKPYNCIPQKLLKDHGFDSSPVTIENQRMYRQESLRDGYLLYIESEKEKDIVLVGYIPRGYVDNLFEERILERVKVKLEKLNSKGYKRLKQNNLAIFVKKPSKYIWCSDEIMKEHCQRLVNTLRKGISNESLKTMFDTIFIVYYDAIIEINTTLWSSKYYWILI